MKVIVIGAGFGGLKCATALSKAKAVDGIEVMLVDRHPYQLFAPLLYQVSTGGLPEDDIAYPVRAAIPGVDFRRGDVVRIDPVARTIRFDDGEVVSYDQLVIATGSVGTTFGVPGVAENALQMKDIAQARAIRHRLLQTYEDVQMGRKPKEALRVVVVGGGPTGVEITGAVAELQKSMEREFPDIWQHAHVTLVEAGPRVLPMFSEVSSSHAKSELEELGADVKVDAAVDRMYPTDVHLKNGEVLPAGTIVWAAGVAAPEQWNTLGLADRMNRLRVNEHLQLTDGVWVVGDTAAFTPEGEERPLPMVAPVAMQMGDHVAEQLIRMSKGEPLKPFRYKDKGQMATIGRRRAVVELPNGMRFHGTLAWLMWLGLHVAYLAGGRNRVSVVADWTWNYIAWGIGPRRTVID